MGSIILFKTKSFDVDTVVYAFKNAISGGIIAGICGYMIGNVLSKSSPQKKLDNMSASIDELLGDTESPIETSNNENNKEDIKSE